MAWTTNDEELLILSDDSDNWSDFVLDEQIIDENKDNSLDSNFISFDSDVSELSNTDTKLDSLDFQVSLDENKLSDDNFSFSVDTEKNEQIESVDTVFEEKNEQVSDFSFWDDLSNWFNESTSNLVEDNQVSETPKVEENFFPTSIVEEEKITTSNESVWTMTDILDEAIAKFVKREELIVSDINSKEEHIKSLKDQIASLESAVNTDNEEVIRLNTEKQSIMKNRKSLEKMKESPVNTK